MNKSFFRGVLAGSILGTVVGLFSAPQKKPVHEYTYRMADRMTDGSAQLGSRARRVLKEITRGVSELIK